MKNLRIMALVLIALLLIPSVLSCAKEAEKPAGNATTAAPVDGDGVIASTTEEKLLPDLPENLNMEGFKFRLLYSKKMSEAEWGVDGIYAETENSEPINDAAFTRNRTLEEKYNVKLEFTGQPSDELTSAFVKKFILAGQDDYEAIVMRQNQLSALITQHMLMDFRELPYIDLQKPWWDKPIMDQLSIGGKYYCGFGDFIVTANNALRVLLFNKDMLRQMGYDMPYEMVKQNKWNLETFASMCRDVYSDENGNGEYDVDDRYGFLAQSGAAIVLLESVGEGTTSKDQDDMPVVSIGSERSMRAMDLITSIFAQKNVALLDTMFSKLFPGTEYKGLQVTFEAKRGLFFAEVLQLAERMRATDVEFGILPMPKLDEFQEKYYSYGDSWCMNHIVIPITNTNQEKTGQMLEALNAESLYTVVPAYYDKSLNGKFVRDNESSEMLDLILDGKRVSMDEMFGWGMYTALQTALIKGDGQYASVLEKNLTKTENAIKKTVDTLQTAS